MAIRCISKRKWCQNQERENDHKVYLKKKMVSKPREENDHEGVSLNCGVIAKKERMTIRCISKKKV